MKNSARRSRKAREAFALHPIACSVMLAWCGGALANPVGPQVAAGAAAFQANGKTLTITNAPGTIINWQSFSIGSGELTRFNQQSVSSAVLNRVVTANPSSILGQLTSNGRVFLVNPHGIVVGAGARVDTAGFIASTLNIADKDFLQGKFRFEGGGNGVVRNEGAIRASGDIVLVGPVVENAGLIRSDSGAVLLAAGRSVTITSPDSQGLKFEVQAPTDTALNIGTIEAATAASMLAGTLRHSGDIRASSASVEGGRVVLSAQREAIVDAGASISANGAQGGNVTIQSADLTSVSGTIEAKGSEGAGGTVRVLGNRVGLFNAATVDVSGHTGGGTILVGGDFQGKNAEIHNAWRTFVGPNTQLRADAGASGDGGKVIVWADDITRFYGAISARGGAQSGNGGFVETSGKESLSVVGARVDTTAPAGRTGTWLLDPKFIVVIAGGAAMPDMVDQFSDDPANPVPATIDPGSINGSVTNVVLQANTDITFDSAINMVEAGVGLTAQAGRSIMVNANIATNNGDVTLVANETTGAGVVAANRDAGAAVLSMFPGTTINAVNGDVRLRLNSGAGHAGTSGDMTIANVMGNNVSVMHDGPTANSSILRADAASLLTGTNSVHLHHTPNGLGARIGTDPAPIRIATPRVEAAMLGGAGGIFIDSSNADDLQIGGVPNTIYAGLVRGVQALAGGPIRIIKTNGNLTRFAGAAGCGPTGGAGGPICGFGNIELRARALGAPGPDGRLHVDGGTVTVEGTSFGGVSLERRGGNLLLSTYDITVPDGQPIELATGNGVLNVDNNINAGGSSVTLVGGGPLGQIAFAGGVTVNAPTLSLGATNDVTFNNGTVALNTLVNASAPLSIGGATVNFAQVSSTSALGVSSGAANFTVDSTFGGPVTLSGGTLGGPGVVNTFNGLNFTGGTIASGGNIMVSGGTTTISTGSPSIVGTLNARTLNMTGGTLNVSGTLTIPGDGTNNASTISNATVNNSGVINLASPGDLNLDNGATINNSNLFDIQTSAGIRHTTGPTPNFVNTGELRKSGGGITSVSIIGNPINVTNAATGTINAQSGTLQISNGLATNDGTINISADATFSTNGGALTNSATGTIGGSGTLDLGGAALTNNGTLRPGPATGGAGVLTITGDLAQAGTLDVEIAGTAPDQIDLVAVSGNATLGGTLNVSHFDGFNPPSDSNYPILTYTSRTGDFATRNFPPGYGTFYSTAPNATNYVLSLGSVVNQWLGPTGAGESGNWQVAGNWSLLHTPTTGEDALIPDGGAPGISETITVSAAGQTARKVTSAENLTVAAGGSFVLGSPGSALQSDVNATFTVNGPTVLNAPLAANAITLGGAEGVLDVANGSLPRLDMTGGTLTRSPPGNVTITGPFTVSGGSIALMAGNLVTQNNTTVTGVVNPLSGWTNSGVLSINGAGQISPSPGSGFVFTNLETGVVNLRGNNANPFSSGIADAQILNTGTFNKDSPSVATQTIDTPFSNTGTGRVEVDSGTLVLPAMTILPGNVPNTQSGTIRVAPGSTLSTGGNNLTNAADGVIGGRGTLDLGAAMLTNDGTLQPGRILGSIGTGTLTIAGNLTQGAGGTVAMQLGGTGDGQHDVLNVTGTANLAGTLSLSAIGGYTPTPSDSFLLLTANPRTGTFPSIVVTSAPFEFSAFYDLDRNFALRIGIDAGSPLNFWRFDSNGDWNVAANWSLGTVPMPNEQVLLDRPAGIFTITVPAAATASLLNSQENLTIAAGGVLGLANASRINGTLAVNGGTLQGTGAMTVNGPLSLDGGTIASPVTVNGTTGVSGGASQLTGSLTTSGLNMVSGSLTVAGSGTLGLTGAGVKTIGASTLTNDGTVNFGGPLGLAMNNGATLDNNAGATMNVAGTGNLVLNGGSTFNNGGTLDFQSDADIVTVVGAGTLTNTGTVRKSAGAGVSTIANPVALTSNGGIFNVLTGTLEFASGNNTFNNNTQFTGPGSHLVTGNSTFNDTITSNGLTLQSGDFAGNAILAGTTAWTGGRMIGTFAVPLGATLNLSGAAAKTLGGGATLTNAGAVNFNVANDSGIGGAGTFQNNNIVNSAGPGITTVVSSTFNNAGTVNVDGGTLRLTGGGMDTGAYAIDAGTTLDFGGGTRVLNAGSGVTGGGTLLVSGGTTNVNTALTAGTLNLTGGTLGGTGNLTVTTGGTWSGGTVSGAAASLTIADGATFGLTSAGAHVVDGARLNVSGTGTVNLTGAGNLVLNNGASVNNSGTLDIQTDADIATTAGTGTFVNTGTVRKSVADGVTTIANPVTLTNSGTFNVLTGTLEFASANNTFNNGTQFTGPGSHLVTGNSAFNGTITSNGLTLQSGDFTGTNAMLAGTTAWTGGRMLGTFTVLAGARLDLSGAAAKTVDGAAALLANSGAMTIADAGSFTLSSGANFTNNASGTATWTGPGGSATINAGSTFTNNGTVNLNATGVSGAGVFQNNLIVNSTATPLINTVVSSTFNNAGTAVNVDGGTLRLTGGGMDTGAYAIDAGTTLDFAAPARALNAGSNVTGAGTLLVSAGTTNVNAAYAPGTTTITGGTANLNGAGAHTTGTLNLSGGTLGGTGNLSVTANGTWTGGTIAGSVTVPAGATLNLAGDGARLVDGAAATLATTGTGTINHTIAGNLVLNNGATLNNAGTYDVQTDGDIVTTAGAGNLVNTGTLRKSVGAGVTMIANPVALTSSGTFNVLTGTLEFASANNTFNNGSQFTGPGSHLVTGNSTFNGTITSNGLTLQSGTFGGNASFAGTTAWTGGTAAGVFTVPAGATLNLTGAAAAGRTLNGAAASLTTNGTVNVSSTADTTVSGGALWDNFGAINLGGGARIVLGGDGAATLVNRGTGVITDTSTNAAPITTAGATKTGKAFSNAGTFNKNSGSADTQTLDAPMTNTGTINVRSGTLAANGFPTNNGIIDLEAGTTFSTGALPFTNSPIGSITGNGTIVASPFTNNGSLGPGDSAGTLTIAGNFVQGPTGTLVIELGGSTAGVDYDRLNVTGNAMLDGALAIFVTPGQTIARGSVYDFMTYASRTGDFTTFGVPPGQVFQLAPGPTGYRIVSTSPPTDLAMLPDVNRVGQRDALVLAERRRDNTLVPEQQQQQRSDEERRRLGDCR